MPLLGNISYRLAVAENRVAIFCRCGTITEIVWKGSMAVEHRVEIDMSLGEELKLYNSTGMFVRGTISSEDAEKYDRAVANFYYLDFHIKDALRDYKCLCCREFFQQGLYGDSNKASLVQYYQHHVVSLFTNVGVVKKLIDKINQDKFTQNIIAQRIDDYPRHKIHHFIQDSDKLRSRVGVIHGLNVIMDDGDAYLRNIKGMNRLIDLINMRYYFLDEKNNQHEVDLQDLERRLQSIAMIVDNVQEFIHNNILRQV